MDGLLKEIFIQDGISAEAQAGTTILKISNLEMKELDEGLFRFTCESADKTQDSVIVHVQSMNQ